MQDKNKGMCLIELIFTIALTTTIGTIVGGSVMIPYNQIMEKQQTIQEQQMEEIEMIEEILKEIE